VTPHLLAPGQFARRALHECPAAGAADLTGILGSHSLLADLVVARAIARAPSLQVERGRRALRPPSASEQRQTTWRAPRRSEVTRAGLGEA
jgi:hypothetical protein